MIRSKAIATLSSAPARSTQIRKWVSLTVDDIESPATGELMAGTVEDKIDIAQIKLALSGNTSAYNVIKEEVYGKRSQYIENTGAHGGPIQYSHTITSEDVKAFTMAL